MCGICSLFIKQLNGHCTRRKLFRAGIHYLSYNTKIILSSYSKNPQHQRCTKLTRTKVWPLNTERPNGVYLECSIKEYVLKIYYMLAIYYLSHYQLCWDYFQTLNQVSASAIKARSQSSRMNAEWTCKILELPLILPNQCPLFTSHNFSGLNMTNIRYPSLQTYSIYLLTQSITENASCSFDLYAQM